MAGKRRRKKNKKQIDWQRALIYEVAGLLLFALTLIGGANLGAVGHTLVQAALFLTGKWYMLVFIGLLIMAGYYIIKRDQPPFWNRRVIGVYIFCFSLLLISHVKLFQKLSETGKWQNHSVIANTWSLYKTQLFGTTDPEFLGGGMIGALGFAFFNVLFAPTGTLFMALFLIIIALILITGKSIRDVLMLAGKKSAVLFSGLKGYFKNKTSVASMERKQKKEEREAQKKLQKTEEQEDESAGDEMEVPSPVIHDFSDRLNQKAEQQAVKSSGADEKAEEEKSIESAAFTPEFENADYQLPGLDLLSAPEKSSQSNERKNIAGNVKKLEKAFDSFGVKARVKKVHLGPAVTKYEVHPDVGVKVSRIVNLNDDLALALAAKEIRIEAPIPGKSAVGIEVPNQEVSMVSLKEVLESEDQKQAESKLSVGLGRDISGEAVMADLSKMPHLLVAGATGSGKSVCINGIITSILMRAKPHEVKLLMVDPKMVELNIYNGVPHLLTPVVTDPKKASQALKKVVTEMERRYELFSNSGTRNLEGYNQYIKKYNEEQGADQPYMPYIVVIIDELADLMMVASKEVEDAITRLAQMARAAGIHLIIATQRPSVDVITGVIKANIPSRIAFSVSSGTDSRTILDGGGAEKLLGKGDMLFMPVGASKPTRIQGAFLSDQEVEAVVRFVVAQQKAQYREDMIPDEVNESDVAAEVDDDLYDEAVQLVMNMQSASVSMLQRRFRVGYTRAARLIDAMEARGVVGPYEGSKPRQVLITQQNDDEAGNQ